MSYKKHLMTSDEPPSELYKAVELSTNLAEVGTDCISRQAAIDTLNEYFARIGKLKRRGLTKGEKAISLDTVGAIKTLPPARPQRIKGHWVDDCTFMGIQCSICGKSLQDYIHATEYAELMEVPNFCPNCGAEMEVTT